jgi:F0F1-type ATP synthase assembly protein I
MSEDQAPPATEVAHPVRRRRDPLFAVLVGVAAGVILAAVRHPQPGMYVVAGALGLGAVLRLVLRPRDAGSLVVRSRQLDVLVLMTLAVAVGVIAALTPFPPGR